MENPNKIIEQINDLIVKNTDAHHLYLTLAEAAEGDLLKGTLKSHADKHRILNLELVAALKAFFPEATITMEGSFTGGLTKGWEEIKKSFNVSSEEGIEETFKDTHNATQALYTNFLSTNSQIPISIKNVLLAHGDWFKKISL